MTDDASNRPDDATQRPAPAPAGGGTETAPAAQSPAAKSSAVRPLQYVRLLSWSFLLLILGFNFGLSVFISNYAD
ncbi:MAG: hypothetical protein AB7D57_11180, partial [Desulfovibrionaceae bacterium]